MKPIVDISYWQGWNYNESPDDPRIDFDKLIANSSGVIARAGYGHSQDMRFDQYAAALGSHLKGAYWYVTDDADPAHQAEAFADAIENVEFGPLWLAGDALLPVLWADCEDNNAGLSKSGLARHYKIFLDQLEALVPWASTRTGIYTRGSFWNDYINFAGWEPHYPLWVAHYTDGAPITPHAWDGYPYILHQYSADGNMAGSEFGVVSRDIDINRVNPEFVAAPEPRPDPEPPPLYVPKMRVLRNVRIRNKPSTMGTPLGTLTAGMIVTVQEIKAQNSQAVWVRHEHGWSALTWYGWRFMDGV